jgi:hypothetical protein
MVFAPDATTHIGATRQELLPIQTVFVALAHLFPLKMISSAWRIPCVLIATAAMTRATTPPAQPPLNLEERAKARSTSLEIVVKQRWARTLVQVCRLVLARDDPKSAKSEPL